MTKKRYSTITFKGNDALLMMEGAKIMEVDINTFGGWVVNSAVVNAFTMKPPETPGEKRALAGAEEYLHKNELIMTTEQKKKMVKLFKKYHK